MEEKKTMLDVAHCWDEMRHASHGSSRYSVRLDMRAKLRSVPVNIMNVAREMAGALKAAYDNMYVQAREEGCMPIEMEIIHNSEKALARAREAGIEVPE